MADRTCPECGQGFTPAHPKVVCCSRSCGAKRSNRAKIGALPERECAHCGTAFLPIRKDGRFCSQRCLGRANVDNPKKTCNVDGCTRPLRARGTCSMHWRRMARAEGREASPEWDDRRRHNYHARRARMKATAVLGGPVLLADIAERDGWACHICCEPVDPTLDWPDPKSPSLDHVVPLARGGAHSPGNVSLAHLTCNVSKGDRLAA